MAKPDPQKFKDEYAAKIVEGFGNDFGSMKSSRLSNALQGAQENIIKQRIDSGEFPIPAAPAATSDTPSEAAPVKKVSVPPVVEAPEIVAFDPNKSLFYGDSIATGLGHGGARGSNTSDAQWGRGSQAILDLIQSRPEGTFAGQDVVLSSGILNSGANFDTVRSQIKALQGKGARSVRLVGVPNTSTYSGWNNRLKQIADETGSTFLGGYMPGQDGVHMTDYSRYLLN